MFLSSFVFLSFFREESVIWSSYRRERALAPFSVPLPYSQFIAVKFCFLCLSSLSRFFPPSHQSLPTCRASLSYEETRISLSSSSSCVLSFPLSTYRPPHVSRCFSHVYGPMVVMSRIDRLADWLLCLLPFFLVYRHMARRGELVPAAMNAQSRRGGDQGRQHTQQHADSKKKIKTSSSSSASDEKKTSSTNNE